MDRKRTSGEATKDMPTSWIADCINCDYRIISAAAVPECPRCKHPFAHPFEETPIVAIA